MDIVDRLLALGFRDGQVLKGFRSEADILELWMAGESKESVRREWRATLDYCFFSRQDVAASEIWLESKDGGKTPGMTSVTLRMARPTTDVWVVGGEAQASREEKNRWEDRGYRARQVTGLEKTPAAGLVVWLENGENQAFSGYLPRHPQSCAPVQSWH